MNTRYTTVNLDVSQQGSIPSITLSQYDLGVGLGFYIMDGGVPYSEFAETDTVVLSGTKPSGVGFTIPAYYKSENLCAFRTTQAMTTEAGTVTCEITITKVNNISVSTANFFVEVEASAHAHETVDEDIEDFGLIADQVGEYKVVAVRAAQQAAQSATQAAASASSAEESMEAAQSAASSAIAAKDDIQEYIDDSEAWALGTRGGEAVPSTDETYENNAKYYAEQSSEASMAAGSSASEAAASAQEAAASVVGAVKYTAQSLTTEQKAQARTNIGAASPSDIPSGTVRYDTSQSLTDAQKTQAKNNIGVPAVDATLAVTGAAADAKKVGDEIADLKGDLNNIEPGLSDIAKTALLNCFSHIAWINEDGQEYYDRLKMALGMEEYTWLYKSSDGVLLSARTDIITPTIGTGCSETLSNGLLRIFVPSGTSSYIAYTLIASTNNNASITVKIKFSSISRVDEGAGARIQISNGNTGAQIYENGASTTLGQYNKNYFVTVQGTTFSNYSNEVDIELNKWYIITVELKDGKQIISVDGDNILKTLNLSSNYCRSNLLIFQSTPVATENPLECYIEWVGYKNNDGGDN